MKDRLLPFAVIAAIASFLLVAFYLFLQRTDEGVRESDTPDRAHLVDFPVELFLIDPDEVAEGHYLLEAALIEELREEVFARLVLVETELGQSLPLVVPAGQSRPPETRTPLLIEWDGRLLLLREVDP